MFVSPFNRITNFVRLIEKKIPAHVRIVAELRLMWEEIVGTTIAKRSQILKCEYLPQQDELGNPTGEYRRRLVIAVNDNMTMTTLTAYADEYLQKIPKRYRIHSMRALMSRKELKQFLRSEPVKAIPMRVTAEEQQKIITKVQNITMSADLQQSMINYLITCKNIQKGD